MKCQASILREYKRKRADSCWPNFTEWDPSKLCGGDITVSVEASLDGYGSCRCDSYAVLELNAYCSRCSMPYSESLQTLRNQVASGRLDLTELLK